jgi:hypothetical protein
MPLISHPPIALIHVRMLAGARVTWALGTRDAVEAGTLIDHRHERPCPRHSGFPECR